MQKLFIALMAGLFVVSSAFAGTKSIHTALKPYIKQTSGGSYEIADIIKVPTGELEKKIKYSELEFGHHYFYKTIFSLTDEGRIIAELDDGNKLVVATVDLTNIPAGGARVETKEKLKMKLVKRNADLKWNGLFNCGITGCGRPITKRYRFMVEITTINDEIICLNYGYTDRKARHTLGKCSK